jgi:hypothetical protein
MSYYNSKQHAMQAVPGISENGGCLSIITLPPVIVLIAGLLLAFGLSRVQITTGSDVESNGNLKQINQNSKIASLFTPEVQRWGRKITIWSHRLGIDPNLAATVMQIESCGNPNALSGAGAMGLFQVMPFHFANDEDPYKPVTNATRGLAYLKSALDTQGGDSRLALAGYNGGITGAKRPESAWPAEMQRYVYWGTEIYRDAKKGKSSSERLDEWLSSGGASLCTQAAQVLGLTPQ